MSELRKGGAFDWVTRLAREPLSVERPLDLGLRNNPKTQVAHATLYVGTTKVLDVKRAPRGGFALKPERQNGLFARVDLPWDGTWERSQPLQELRRDMSRIRARVEAALDAVPVGRKGEGFLQAAIAKAEDKSFSPVDREIMFSWATRAIKTDGKERLRQPLTVAQERLAAAHAWAKGRPVPGDKIDALAIDDRGRLLVIEVKPGTASGTVVWTPMQVAVYVQLVRAWCDDNPESAREVCVGMAQQRVELGLTTAPTHDVRLPVDVVPVIAFGTPVLKREDSAARFERVREAVDECGVDLPALELWTVSNSGEVTRTDALGLDERFD